ncbi:MAG: hypothetical protein M1491_02240 [Deltaproteobacteria bacterium]|nr:hypothetical protein [Deltaproteobacteria bacterium]MCL5278177.1 hypothetical protein [Deltaproteobacteria bacterium]
MNEELKRKIKIIVIIYVFLGIGIGGALQDFNKSLTVTNSAGFDTRDVMPFYINLILSIGLVVASIIQKIRVKGKFIPLFLLFLAITIFPWYFVEPSIYHKFGFICILIIKNVELISVIAFAYFLYKAFINDENFIVDKQSKRYTLWDIFTVDWFKGSSRE